MKKLLQVCAVLAFSIGAISCSDDSESSASKLSFETSSSTVDEGSGSVAITLKLNKAASKNVSGTVSLSGTAALNGDYTIDDLSFEIPKGQTSVELNVDILDEPLIEAEDELIIKLESASGASIDSKKSSYTLTIEDDDDSPSEGELQTDLSWSLGEGEDIDQIDLDLYHVTGVIIEDNVIVDDGESYNGSENEFGFESLRFVPGDPDDEYYVVVVYFEGTKDLDFFLTYTDDSDSETVEGTFSDSDEGVAVFYGPLVKDGNDYTAGRQGGRAAKPNVYRKKLDAELLNKLKAAKK